MIGVRAIDKLCEGRLQNSNLLSTLRQTDSCIVVSTQVRMSEDLFDGLLGLEEQFHNEGYQLGIEDGSKAGRIEGRVFGLERGFEKYVEMGKLHGRSLVWNGRHEGLREANDACHRPVTKSSNGLAALPQDRRVPDLPANARLEKHLRVLYALTEPDSLSTENGDDSVSDFDDRMKRAQGKIKIIERLIGEDSMVHAAAQVSNSNDGQNIEDVDILKARH